MNNQANRPKTALVLDKLVVPRSYSYNLRVNLRQDHQNSDTYNTQLLTKRGSDRVTEYFEQTPAFRYSASKKPVSILKN